MLNVYVKYESALSLTLFAENSDYIVGSEKSGSGMCWRVQW